MMLPNQTFRGEYCLAFSLGEKFLGSAAAPGFDGMAVLRHLRETRCLGGSVGRQLNFVNDKGRRFFGWSCET